MQKIPLAQIGYASEWALAKFFSAFAKEEIQERFTLECICGREKTKEEAFARLSASILARVQENGSWRAAQRTREIHSLLELMQKLYRQEIAYFPVNEDQSLPEEVYGRCEAVIIQATAHYGYIQDALQHDKHILCEKPLVSLLNELGEPEKCWLSRLEELTAKARAEKPGLILMDAEHYLYKPSALIFYENQKQLLRERKIRALRGELMEKDNPAYPRTRKICQQNGLLADTGAHLLAFISCLGGMISKVITSDYDSYPGYWTDTYDHTEFKVRGERFVEQAEAAITVAKFIDRFTSPIEKEAKYLHLVLDDGAEIQLDFSAGSVTEISSLILGEDRPGRIGKERKEYALRYALYDNEYVQILNHFYEAIVNGAKPRTDFSSSLLTLQNSYRLYTFPGRERVERYKKELSPVNLNRNPPPKPIDGSPPPAFA